MNHKENDSFHQMALKPNPNSEDSFPEAPSDHVSYIANSKTIQSIFNLASYVALSDSTVMIYGESGSGKEVLARHIYNCSPRSGKVLLPVNCASIPKELMESEFFGYEKGAFTGANSAGKSGIFELANGGTIFLDEVGELSLELQAKFLRVLENGEFRRIGGQKELHTDVRIIGATNRDLWEMVQRQAFREDLYYRLNIIPITVPPLRERTEDIIPIAHQTLNRLNLKYEKNKSFSKETTDYFLSYDWPGNIRELRNFIERLYVTSPMDLLTLDNFQWKHLSRQSFSPGKNAFPETAGSVTDLPTQDAFFERPLKEAVHSFEKEYIEKVIAKYGGNMTRASNHLGIHRTNLYQKIDKLGINVSDILA